MTGDPAPGSLPQQVRLAATLLLGLGGLLVLSGVLVFLARTNIADGVVATAQEQGSATTPDRSELAGSLAVVGGVFVAVGAGALIAGYYLRQRRSWARFAGLGLGVLLGVLSVQSLLAGGGGPITLLLPIAAIGVAVTVVSALLSPSTGQWLRGERA
ncbi:MAG: hypothetical protein H0V67_12505 [Geodermatophilaceae bacterium]|nr:hypothetical protein [Geodermatophilaceae bacterium]